MLTTDVISLPPDRDNRLELSFRRLLRSVQHELPAALEAASLIPQSTDAPPHTSTQLLKMQHAINTLRDQLSDLSHGGSSLSSVGHSKLALYRQQVDALVSLLPPISLPAYCLKPQQRAAAPTQTLRTAADALASPALAPDTVERAVVGLAAGISSQAADRLAEQEQLQDGLTDELLEMAAAMKAQALQTQEAVAVRGGLVDTAEAKLVTNVASAQAVAAKAKQQYGRAGSTFCLTCGVLLLVGVVLALMAVYIKFTRWAGYRAHYPGMPARSYTGALSAMIHALRDAVQSTVSRVLTLKGGGNGGSPVVQSSAPVNDPVSGWAPPLDRHFDGEL
ncbi:hypothetical protein V8C86DRAFT_2767726 [Haematococcus lacustris]